MNKKLNAKDFILIGVLTALMWIICMIISTVMSIAGPITNVFLSCCRSNPQRNRDDAVAGKSPEERRVYNLRNNSGYPVFAGWRILADPCCADYWRGNLRFPDYGQK